MTERPIPMSDFTDNPILNRDDLVRVIIWEHPQLKEPRRLDATVAELAALEHANSDFVILSVGEGPRIALDAEEFNSLFVGLDPISAVKGAAIHDVAAEPVPRRRTAQASKTKLNYKELPAAGMPHRGRVTPEEAATVRNNLAEVNRNRVAAGVEPIDPTDERDCAKYGFNVIELG